MVEVIFKRSDYGYHACQIRQHAGDALICSAVSALGMALVGTLKTFTGIRFNNCYYGDGLIDIDIDISLDETYQSYIDTVFNTIYIGLQQLATTYPNNVRVIS